MIEGHVHVPRRIEGFKNEYRFLSNFPAVRVTLDGDTYPSVEHAYQAAKTTDRDKRRGIKMAASAAIAKRLGKKLPVRADWEKVRDQTMFDLLVQKFSQDEFRDQLLATGDAYIEETNHWGDVYWGVCNGVGQNKLGLMLMEIREALVDLERTVGS